MHALRSKIPSIASIALYNKLYKHPQWSRVIQGPRVHSHKHLGRPESLSSLFVVFCWLRAGGWLHNPKPRGPYSG